MHKKLWKNKKKSKFFTALISIAIFIGIFFTCINSPTAQTVPDHIVISEVLYNASIPTNQFIELYNPTLEAVSLDGWNLSHYDETGALVWSLEFDASHTIAAHSYYLIGNSTTISIPDVNSVDSDITFSGSLEAGPDDYLNLTDESGTYIDGVRWGHIDSNNPPEIKDVPDNTYVAPNATEDKSIHRRILVNEPHGPYVCGPAPYEPYGPYETPWAYCQDTDNNTYDFVACIPTPTNSTGTSQDPAPVLKIVGDPHILISPDVYTINTSTPIHLNISKDLMGNWTLHYRAKHVFSDTFPINTTTYINETSPNITIYLTDNCTHYFEYYVENTTTTERYPKEGWDNETFYVDLGPPQTSVDAFASYEQDNVPFDVNVTASADEGCPESLNGIATIELWYRYSTDNSSWSPYVLYDTDDFDPYQWSFDAPNDSGYYEFYSIGIDNLSQREAPPTEPDARCNVTAPITRKHHSPPPITVGMADYINSSTEFNFTIDDPDGDPSDVIIKYRWWWNGNWLEWKNYTGNFTMSGSCKHYLEYYAYEPNGTTEYTHNQTYYLDDDPPTSTLQTGNPEYNNYVNTNTEFNLTASDQGCNNGVGVKEINYSTDGGSTWDTYTGNFTLPDTLPCQHDIHWYAVDHLGNKEPTQTQTFYVDTSPPSSSLSVVGEQYNDFINTASVIQLDATDDDGNCDVENWKINYSIWYDGDWDDPVEGNWNSVISISFSEACEHRIKWHAIDRVGNIETPEQESTFYVDDSPPETTPVVHGPNETGGGFTWINDSSYITFTTTENGCNGGAGVDKTYFRYVYQSISHPTGSTDTEYGTPVNIGGTWYWTWVGQQSQKIRWSNDCVHTLYYYSVDNVANAESEKSTIYRVDTTPPNTAGILTISGDSYSTGGDTWVTTSTLFSFDTSPDPDGTCTCCIGLDTILYRILKDPDNDGWDGDDDLVEQDWQTYTGSFMMPSTCHHKVEWYGRDQLGNNETAIHMQEFYVDDTPPASTKTIGDPKWPTCGTCKGQYVNTSTSITLDATDGGSCKVDSYRIHYEIYLDTVLIESSTGNWDAPVTIEFDEECNHTLEWWSEDRLGNTETRHSQYHYVDDTPPDTDDILTITGTNYTDGYNTWVTTSTLFSFDTSPDPDGTCTCCVGLHSIKYRILKDPDNDGWDGDDDLVEQDWQTYTGSFMMPSTCHHKVEWYGRDQLGNKESINTQEFFVDDTAPQTTQTYGNPHYYDSGTQQYYTTLDTPIHLNATDILHMPTPSSTDTSGQGTGTIIGVAPTTQTVYTHQTFTIDIKLYPDQAVTGAQFTLNYDPNLLSLTDITPGDAFIGYPGYHITQYDNTSGTVTYAHALTSGTSITQQGSLATLTFTAKEIAITTDLTLSDIIIGTPSATAIPSPTINHGEVYITQTCDVGLYYIYYRMKEDNTWSSWQRGDLNQNMIITPTIACEHEIQYYAEDILGHQSDIETVTFYVDDTPPSTTLEYGSPHHIINGKHYIQPTTPLYLNATDPAACAAGANEIHYGVYHPETGWTNATSSIPQVSFTPDDIGITTQCLHTLSFYATDNLGLTEDTLQQSFYIDTIPPDLAITQPQGGQYHSDIINISWELSDTCDPAPTANVSYSNDSGSNWYPLATDLTSGHYEWDISTLPLGSEYHIRVIATDEIGNTHTETTDAFTIDNTNPVISDVTAIPDPQEIHHLVNISAQVTDETGLSEVVLNIIRPDDSVMELSIIGNQTTSRYYTNRSFHQLGTYTYTVIATDLANNTATSTGHQFTIQDTTPPEITDVKATPVTQEIGHHVNISAIVTDNVAVQDVHLAITAPDDSTTNLSITSNHLGDTYYLNQTYHQIGHYQFTIYATDTSDNHNHSATHTFTIIITHLDIAPSSQFQYTGDPVTVDITLYPSQPVSGAQFNLTYNASLLTAHTVSYGDVFGSSSYFQSGTIDAANGTITNVAAVSTAGPLTTNGTLATITFTANNIHGTTPLNLTHVIIGNATAQPIHPIQTYNGTVTIANDTTPPQITKTIGSPSYNDHITSTTPITLTATDPGAYASGVHAIHYILDGEETVIQSDTTQLTIPTEGTHTLEFWATDNMGNEAIHTTQTHYVDDTPPTITDTYAGPASDGYLNTNTTITLTATDPGSTPSGINAIHYIITYPNNTTKEMTITANTTTLSFTEPCNHTLEFWAIDNLGHTSTHTTRQYHVDTTPPSSTVEPITPYTQNLTATITITATDNGCANGVGLSTITLWYRYSPDNTSWDAWTAYTTISEPTTISFTAPNGSGYYQFYTTAIDKLYNQETAPVTPDTIANIVSQTVHTFQLSQGWNLISLPIQHNYTAETLGQAIGGTDNICDAIVRWDTLSQDYEEHLVGTPIDDFTIQNGVGYFVHVTNNTTFTMAGEPIDNISVALEPGWNMIGYAQQQTLPVDTIGSSVSGCDAVMQWDATIQDFQAHPIGTPINNFDVHIGTGLFLHTTQPTTWNGGPP